ncbi:MAG: hypothetical protein M3Y57_13550 [Acidobacteriota bacterium]|nr:hypothetical protein [Acidobacteriota bacterium]
MATGSGKTLKLLIDLANINAYLNLKAAQELGVSLQSLKGGDGTDITAVQQTTVAGARLGDLPLGDFPFMALDETALPADGALTYGSFQNRLLQLDFAKHLVRISEPENEAQPCPHSCGDLVIRRVGQFGPATLTVSGFEINQQPVTAQIDTLFTGTMLIYPNSVEKLGLKKASKSKNKDEFPYTQGGLKLARADGQAFSFHGAPLLQDGPVYFWSSKDEAPPSVTFDATIGTALLSRGVVTFDFKGKHVWMD